MLEGLAELADKVPGWVLILLTFLLGGGSAAAIQALRDVALRALELHHTVAEPARILRPIEVLRDSDEMWGRLRDLLELVGAERVLLLRQENGGKLPTVGRPLTASIDLEATAPGVRAMKMDFQNQLLDSHLTHALVEMYAAGALEMLPENARGIARGSMSAADDPTVHLFPVFTTPGTFYYLALHFRPDAAPPLCHALYRDRVRITVAALSQIFKRWHDGTLTD